MRPSSSRLVPGLLAAALLAAGPVALPLPDATVTPAVAAPLTSPYTVPFTQGVNLSGWFQYTDLQHFSFTRFTAEDFAQIRSLGADVIRLPVDFEQFTGPAPGYEVNPTLYYFLDQALDMAAAEGFYLLLDYHRATATPATIGDFLVALWTQLAAHYEPRDDRLFYEIMNEPYEIDATLWGEIQGDVIDAIRAQDDHHRIIVSGADYGSNLAALPVYDDPGIVYTYHFYEPFVFTHQGTSWTILKDYTGVRFPATGTMPPVPESLQGTWVEADLQPERYALAADPATLGAHLDTLVQYSIDRQRPLFIGEFGVYIPATQQPDRVAWYSLMAELFAERGLSWTMWEYDTTISLFKTAYGGRDFYNDIDPEVVAALGFTPPEPRPVTPLRDGFDVYTDYLGDGVTLQVASPKVDLYAADAASGPFALSWTRPDRYEAMTFAFSGAIDWAGLAADGARLVFRAKNTATQSVDVRFVDSPADGLPWRNSATVTAAAVPADGQWHEVTLNLSDFQDAGAYNEGQWVEPRGEFDWNRVAALQFVAEDAALPGTLLIDDLKGDQPAGIGDLRSLLAAVFARLTALIHRLIAVLTGVAPG
jgi:endoglucanase